MSWRVVLHFCRQTLAVWRRPVSLAPDHDTKTWRTADPSVCDWSSVSSWPESSSDCLRHKHQQLHHWAPVQEHCKCAYSPVKASSRGASMVRASEPVRWGVRPASTNSLVAMVIEEPSASSNRTLAEKLKHQIVRIYTTVTVCVQFNYVCSVIVCVV